RGSQLEREPHRPAGVADLEVAQVEQPSTAILERLTDIQRDAQAAATGGAQLVRRLDEQPLEHIVRRLAADLEVARADGAGVVGDGDVDDGTAEHAICRMDRLAEV